jgi:hypothetical protein
MTLDPRWSFWLSVSLAVLAFLSGASAQFSDLGFDPHVVKAMLAIVTLMLGIGNSLNAVLAAIPSKPGDPNFFLGPKVAPKDAPK